MGRRQDTELVSMYRDAPSEHVNPPHASGLRRVYDQGHEDGYEQARAEFEKEQEEHGRIMAGGSL